MPSLEDVKNEIKAEKNKVFASIEAIIGSPYAVAFLLAAAIAFASHMIYAPNRLAPVAANFSTLTLGLPPMDFGVVGQGVHEATDAAIRQGGGDVARDKLAQNAWATPLLNALGLGVALVLLAWNFGAMLRRKRAETRRRLGQA